MRTVSVLYVAITFAAFPLGRTLEVLDTPLLTYKELEAALSSQSEKYIPNETHVETCILNGWWDLAKRIILLSHQEGIDLSYKVRTTVQHVQKECNELLQVLNKHYDEPDVVNVAFQWAESPGEVYLAVKFSNRWSSPGALVVTDESLDVQGNTLRYSSKGTLSDKLKVYQLVLELHDEVIPDETKVTPVSMGRFTITLKKARAAVWERLTKTNEKIPNQQIWWEMKEKYQDACEQFLESETDEHSDL